LRIFEGTIGSYLELMNDPFGNYLTQKLTEKLAEMGRDEEMIKIVKSIEKEPVSLCKNAHGTRSIQKIIEIVKKEEQIYLLVRFLKDKVRYLAEDINGNHVI